MDDLDAAVGDILRDELLTRLFSTTEGDELRRAPNTKRSLDPNFALAAQQEEDDAEGGDKSDAKSDTEDDTDGGVFRQAPLEDLKLEENGPIPNQDAPKSCSCKIPPNVPKQTKAKREILPDKKPQPPSVCRHGIRNGDNKRALTQMRNALEWEEDGGDGRVDPRNPRRALADAVLGNGRQSHFRKVMWNPCHPTAPFVACEFCTYKTISVCTLQEHVRILHADKKIYVCDLCQYVCSDLECLKRHLRAIHPPNYVCPHCDMGLPCRSCRDAHIRSHTESRKVRCARCSGTPLPGKRGRRPSGRSDRVFPVDCRRQGEREGPAAPKRAKEPKGPGERTPNLSLLHPLMRSAFDLPAFSCDRCYYKVTNRMDLREHYRNVHGTDMDPKLFQKDRSVLRNFFL